LVPPVPAIRLLGLLFDRGGVSPPSLPSARTLACRPDHSAHLSFADFCLPLRAGEAPRRNPPPPPPPSDRLHRFPRVRFPSTLLIPQVIFKSSTRPNLFFKSFGFALHRLSHPAASFFAFLVLNPGHRSSQPLAPVFLWPFIRGRSRIAKFFTYPSSYRGPSLAPFLLATTLWSASCLQTALTKSFATTASLFFSCGRLSVVWPSCLAAPLPATRSVVAGLPFHLCPGLQRSCHTALQIHASAFKARRSMGTRGVYLFFHPHHLALAGRRISCNKEALRV